MLQKSRAGKKATEKVKLKKHFFSVLGKQRPGKVEQHQIHIAFHYSKACSTRFFVTRRLRRKVAVYKLHNSQIAEDGVFVTD